MFPDGCIEGLSSDTVTFGLDFCVFCVLPACMYVHHMCAWCPQRSQEDTGFLELELLIVRKQVVLGTEPLPLDALTRGATAPVPNLCALR